MTKIDFGKAKLTDQEAEFVAVFMRLEFALKEAGFCTGAAWAAVDWKSVARSLGDEFYSVVSDTGVADLMLRKPAKRQVVRQGALGWEDRPMPRDTESLVAAIRSVRNNLLHGGKHGDEDANPEDAHRNGRLVTEARCVIEMMLFQLGETRAYFEGKY